MSDSLYGVIWFTGMDNFLGFSLKQLEFDLHDLVIIWLRP